MSLILNTLPRMKTKTLFLLCGILFSGSLFTQTLTAYRSGVTTTYTAAELTIGTLSDVDSLEVFGTWTNENLLALQQGLKTS